MKNYNSITSALILEISFILACLSSSSIRAADISLVEFQGMLFSELNSEIKEVHLQSEENHQNKSDFHSRIFLGRFLKEQDVPPKAQGLWNKIMQHGWNSTSHLLNRSNLIKNRGLKKLSNTRSTMIMPYIVCSHSSNKKTGFERLEPMLKFIGAYRNDAIVVLNKSQKTCYHVSLDQDLAQSIRYMTVPLESTDDYYTIAPFTDLMKIQLDTMNSIYDDDSWAFPLNTPTSITTPNNWVRTIKISISPGHRMNLSKGDVVMSAKKMLNDIRSLGESGAKNRQRRLKEGKRIPFDDNSSTTALSGIFSMTSSEGHVSTNVFSSSKWSRALELGLEANHTCQTMFDTLDISAHYGNQGFDIVLNSGVTSNDNENNDGIEKKERTATADEIGEVLNESKYHKAESEHSRDERRDSSSSSTNKHCAASLIMALSTHPLVLSVEIEGSVDPTDFESQWITQSKTPNQRPLRDMGINGEGQIISIIDHGLDINNKYFGPIDTKVFDEWDYSQRKVVRYDHSSGDKNDRATGHGTKVAGVAAGQSNDGGDDEANGIASGAKLHIFDFFAERGRYPDPHDTFKSMHNINSSSGAENKNKPHARIANASFVTSTKKPYPSMCRELDKLLHGYFEGDLYVASAGNDGLDKDLIRSVEMTISNPAACKNSLAVGASQSHGSRLDPGEKGMDYLAAFSSRGPTTDGRMKPDLVAPGASVLTAKAHDSTQETVQPPGGGTSYAAPNVSGNAALVRQYFEEGKAGDRCGLKNCKFDPSGTLVKAVLLNSARPLKQVQVVQLKDKTLLEAVSEYDSNQGLGLIQLDKTLPIPGHNKINAIVRNKKEIKDKQDQYIYIQSALWECRNEPYMHEFSATLTWYDPEGAIGCKSCMLNDLDIIVHDIDASGKVIWSSGVFPNGGTKRDSKNNVERIRFNMKWKKRYRIRIKAKNLIDVKTKYSMVASGCFKVIKKPAVF